MRKIRDILSFLKPKTPVDIFSLLGSITIIIAALIISSRKAIKPKIRIWAFTFYIGTCIFLGTMGVLMNSSAGDWMVIQQVFLFFVNIRGIHNARKEFKNPKRDPFDVIVPDDFWEDILKDNGMEHDY